MALLRVVTQNNARVECYSDGVLLMQAPYHGAEMGILAMSLIGPEEAVRSIAAGCRVTPGDGVERTTLAITADDGTAFVTASWRGDWNSGARVLGKGALHLCAHSTQVCEVYSGKPMQPMHRMVYPDGPEPMHLQQALYNACLVHYTTPLIPPGRPGQPQDEAKAGQLWRGVIGRALARDSTAVTMLEPHPATQRLGLVNHWPNACALRVTEAALDHLVCDLVRRGVLEIPKPKEVPCPPKESASSKREPAVAASAR